MRVKSLVLLVGLSVLVAMMTMAVAQSSPTGAKLDKGQVQLKLLLELPKSPSGEPAKIGDIAQKISNIGSSGEDGVRFVFDSFFDIDYLANIGSSGLDGGSFQVDSFFDVFYEIDFDSPGPGTIPTEMIAMQLTGTLGDPADLPGLLDAVKGVVADSKGQLHRGHVTVLK